MKSLIYSVVLLPIILHGQSIVAHRGASYDAPQNTIPAFELAWEQGADFIEADFYLTADKKVICFHDKTTGKIADKNLSVEKSTWAELQKLDVGYKKNKKWKGTRIPLLRDVLKTIPNNTKGIFIEIKSGTGIIPYIKPIIEASGLEKHQVFIISFKKDVLIECKKQMPQIKTQWLISLKKNKKTGKVNYNTVQLMDTLKQIKADIVGTSLYSSVVTAENINKMQSKGYKWNVWTINKAKDAISLKTAGVDFITTDRPAYIRDQFKINRD